MTDPSIHCPCGRVDALSFPQGLLLVSHGHSTSINKGDNKETQRLQGLIVSTQKKYHGHVLCKSSLAWKLQTQRKEAKNIFLPLKM